MAEFAALPLSDLARVARWDAEFFSPTPVTLVAQLNRVGAQPLGALIAVAQRGLSPEYDAVGTVPVIRTVNVREFEFSDVRQEYVTAEFCARASKGAIGPGDIVVTSTGVGTLGRVFCNAADRNYFADGHITVLTPRVGVDAAYLTAVLQSKVGLIQFERWQRGSSGQIEIYPEDILQVLIPRLPEGVRVQVAALWQSAVDLVERSRSYYPDAEGEMLDRLGWAASHGDAQELHFVESSSALLGAGRADAEHFQPKYQRLREHLRSEGARRVGGFCSLPTRGVQPTFVADGDVLVFASKATRPQGVNPDADARTSAAFWEAPENAKARVRRGDVLLNSTGVGTLGRATFYNGDARAVADNHVAVFRPDESVCLPVYLSLFLNSPAGVAQSEMFQTGSSGQLEIYPQHIQEILVFLPRGDDDKVDIAWQGRLAARVTGAGAAKEQAQANLTEAKRVVEESLEYEGRRTGRRRH